MTRFVTFAAVMLFATAAFGQCLLTNETETIPPFFVGQHNSFQIQAVSGTEPYTWEILQGELPAGLHLTPRGKIIGKPEAEADVAVLFRVSDAAGCGLGITYNIVVFNP